MTHPSDDALAGLAIGDADVPPEVADHAASCQRCQGVLGELADFGVLLAEHSSVERPEPSSHVWEGIRAATLDLSPGISSAQPDSVASADGSPEGSAQRLGDMAGRRAARAASPARGMPPWAMAAAAAALVVAGFSVGRFTSSTAGSSIAQPTVTSSPSRSAGSGTVVTAARLTSLDGARALGDADVESVAGQLVLHVRAGSITAPAGGYLEIWLINTDGVRMVSVGLLEPGREATVVVPPGLLEQGYRIVDVSNEMLDDKPAHSGDSVMRGSLPA